MRVISLYQPYATLAVLGLKQFETRHWDTKVRGPLLIHATAVMPNWCRELMYTQPFRNALASYGYNALNLPKGKIVGQVSLIKTVSTRQWITERTVGDGIQAEWMDEMFYGDFSDGRFAWQLANPVRLSEPIPAKGSQGFWQFDRLNAPKIINPQMSVFE